MIFLGLLWWYLDMVVISPDHRCLGFLSLAHGKIALPWPLEAVCCHITCFSQWNVRRDVSFTGGIFFTANLCFDTPSFPSISATNLYLHFYLCFCLCLHLYLTHSLALTVSLLVTHIHTSHVFLSTPLLHSLLLTDPFAYGPAHLPPENDSPGPQVYTIKFPEKRIWLPKPEVCFHPWIM